MLGCFFVILGYVVMLGYFIFMEFCLVKLCYDELCFNIYYIRYGNFI